MGVGSEYLEYINSGATRNKPLTQTMEERLREAVAAVYGPGYTAQVYSGGQEGRRRIGSVRHNHGKAGDIYIQGPDGRVTGDGLAPLGQYWAAKGYGGVGMEMRGGGIHLDEWSTPPKGGGMSWNYANQGGQYTPTQRAAIEAGLAGKLPGQMAGATVPVSSPQLNPTPQPSPVQAALSFLGGAQKASAIPSAAAQAAPMAGGNAQPVAAQFPQAPVQQQGLIPMLQSGQPLNMDTAKTFLGGAQGPMAGASAGLGLLAQGLGGGGAPEPVPMVQPADANAPDLAFMQMLTPKRKRMMQNGIV